jgi:hypothetical protein
METDRAFIAEALTLGQGVARHLNPTETDRAFVAEAIPRFGLDGRGCFGSGSQRTFTVELKVVEIRDGKEQECCRPQVTFLEGAPAVVQIGNWVGLSQGCIDDLVTHANYVPPEDRVRLGNTMRVKVVTAGVKDLVRVDLSMEKSEVEMADKSCILLIGKSLRAVQKARLGKAVKLVLDKDAQGTARAWVEFTVREGSR